MLMSECVKACLFLNMFNFSCLDCGNNSLQSRVLPTVRAPAKSSDTSNTERPQAVEKSSDSSRTAAEGYLEEAYKGGGFSTSLHSVSLSQLHHHFPKVQDLCGHSQITVHSRNKAAYKQLKEAQIMILLHRLVQKVSSTMAALLDKFIALKTQSCLTH